MNTVNSLTTFYNCENALQQEIYTDSCYSNKTNMQNALHQH